MRFIIPLLALAHVACCRASVESWESLGWACEEKESSAVCSAPVVFCTSDGGSCAYTEITENYDEQGKLANLTTCNRWNPDPTGERRDGCVTSVMDGFMAVSCVAEFEDASGAMVTCSACSPCADGLNVTMDCTNVVPAKEPYTCQLVDLNDGGEFPLSPGGPNTATGSSPSAPAPAPSGTAGGTGPSSSNTSGGATSHQVSVFVGLVVAALSLLA